MYLTRRSELLRKRLFVPFFCAVGQLFRETRVLIIVCGLSLVSTSVEHVLQKRGTVSLVFQFFCASGGNPLSVLFCHPCTNREV